MCFLIKIVRYILMLFFFDVLKLVLFFLERVSFINFGFLFSKFGGVLVWNMVEFGMIFCVFEFFVYVLLNKEYDYRCENCMKR